MLRIVESRSSAAAKSYYTEGLSREDYYREGSEIIGRWGGKGAVDLGLGGDVDRASFERLADNQTPEGAPLTVRTKDHRRVGYDFNFHAPKSLSLLYGHTGDERVLQAFRSAVDLTMREIESEMKTRVRRAGAQADRTTGNMVWAEFVHFTSRPVHGTPDPHLHAHCFAFNATHDRAEGRWKAGQFGEIKRDARYFEAVFHARLSRSLADLGYGIERTAKGWELAGIEKPLREKFSRRTEEIEKLAAERGLSGEAKAQLGAITRHSKKRGLSWEDLQSLWRSRLAPEEAERLNAVAAKRVPAELTANVTPSEVVRFAGQKSFERESAVPEKDLLRNALRAGYGSVEVDQVKEAARGAEWLRREIDGRTYCTAKAVLSEEREMLAYARDGRGREKPLGRPNHVPTDPRLSTEQQAAVSHILSSRDRVIALRGGAGTGKTTLLQEAARGIRDGGHELLVFASTANAARGVLRREGFGNADTVSRLLLDPDLQAKAKGQVIWIDEAGLLGSRQLREVFRIAEEQRARVVLSGDVRQHSAVERGDALRLLETRAGIRPVEVNEIRRQRGAYKEAVAALAGGEVEKGFERLEKLGAVQAIPDTDQRYQAIAKDYVEARASSKSALVVAPTHAEGERVTAAIRETLRESGQLGKSERPVTALVNLQWTYAERSDVHAYKSGQVVVFHQNAPGGFKRGETVEVIGRSPRGGVLVKGADGEPRQLPFLKGTDRFGVYAPRPLALAAGDTIRATKNAPTADGQHRLFNGALYEVKGFDREGQIVLTNGWKLPPDFGHLAHGYCTTSHTSQGKTVDRVLLAQSAESFPASSREQFYVSVSRGKESVKIYTDDRDALRAAVAGSGRRMSAVELIDRAPANPTHSLHQFVQRWQQLRMRISARLPVKGVNLEL
jgi:conjugative relaxase-like TrwC/TraI family protein